MANNIYILTFDRDENFDYNKLHQFIKNDTSEIVDWWHYIKSSYLLVSPYSADFLANKIMQVIPNQHFLVIKLNPIDHQGWLTKDAWDWISKYKYL